jgi:hypothetical protein
MDAMADTALTLREAAAAITDTIGPPVTEIQLRLIVRALGWAPVEHRRLPVGRPAPAYKAEELMRLHAAISPWLARHPALRL